VIALRRPKQQLLGCAQRGLVKAVPLRLDDLRVSDLAAAIDVEPQGHARFEPSGACGLGILGLRRPQQLGWLHRASERRGCRSWRCRSLARLWR